MDCKERLFYDFIEVVVFVINENIDIFLRYYLGINTLIIIEFGNVFVDEFVFVRVSVYWCRLMSDIWVVVGW